MTELIYIVRNEDGDIVGAVEPDDQGNPQATREVLEAEEDIQVEPVIVNTLADWLECHRGI